jgi:predicted TIM-barrel fold metal-dependent hydrolase
MASSIDTREPASFLRTPAALPSLTAFASRERILFGSDFPYVTTEIAASFTAKLDAYDGLSKEAHKAISHLNAWNLIPRLLSRDPSAGCSKTVTFDRNAAAHPGFEALR